LAGTQDKHGDGNFC